MRWESTKHISALRSHHISMLTGSEQSLVLNLESYSKLTTHNSILNYAMNFLLAALLAIPSRPIPKRAILAGSGVGAGTLPPV